jgi:predicted NAD-dependent protein-ADP-ribosyltransferase YbiA (DUF1768 family)
MEQSNEITDAQLDSFFEEQTKVFQSYSQMRKNLTNAVQKNPRLLKALCLEAYRTPRYSELTPDDAAYLKSALSDVKIEGFYSRSTELGFLDNLNTRPSYKVTLESGKEFMCKRPEGAFQHQKLSDEAQQLTLREIYDKIDPNVKQEKYVNAFNVMMQLAGEDYTYSEAIVYLSGVENHNTVEPNERFIPPGTIIAWASRVRTTIPGYLRPNWDERESKVAMAYSDLSVMLRSEDTLKTLMKTTGFLIEDTQKARDAIWGFSSDFRSKEQILDGKNYLGLIHTIFRHFLVFLKLGSVGNREEMFESIYKIMPQFVQRMIVLMDKIMEDCK